MLREIDGKRLKALAGGTAGIQAEKRRRTRIGYKTEYLDLLLRCSQDWDALAEVRRDHERNVRYKDGDQWSDVVPDPDRPGRMIREDVLISRSGRTPLKHNYLQQFLKNIVGHMINSPSQPVVYARTRDDQELGNMLTNALQACHELNEVEKLDIVALIELCVTGIVCGKVRYDYWSTKNRTDGKVDLVNINRLFYNADIEDVRLFDLRRIGELHDYTFADLVRNFATSRADEKALAEIYGACRDAAGLEGIFNEQGGQLRNLSFLVPNDPAKYRVIEVWEKIGRWVLYCHDYADGTEEVHTDLKLADIEAINARRLEAGMAAGLTPEDIKTVFAREQYEYFWRVRYLTPNGYCIKEMETPYTHEQHPYVLGTLPLLDGKFKALLSDIIDIQRYINRLLTMLDFIIGSSAKGLLMVPEEAIPDGMDIDDFAREYVKTNGVILLRKGAGDRLPRQIAVNGTDIGAWEMFAQEMQIMQQISGLSNAVQGQTPRAGTPSSLYAQETQNSLTNLAMLFKCFNLFCKARDEKLLKVIMQYTDERRYIDLNGRAYDRAARYYEPEMVRKIIDFNLTVKKSNDTPVYRQMADELLLELLKAGQIPLEIFLSNTSSLPFADKLLADMKALKEQAAAGQINPELLAQMRQQAGQNSDPRAMELMQRFMGQGQEPAAQAG